jgi:molecular chaperone Hsp33
MSDSDALTPFLFEGQHLRGEMAHLDASWRAVLERRAYPQPVRDLLGQAMAATALLIGTIKLTGRLTLQIQSTGPVRLVLVQCSNNRRIRGLARWETLPDSGHIGDLCPNGTLAITLEPEAGQQYQGIVDLGEVSVSEALERYFAQSEQLPTRLWLAADDQRASGLLLQRLPAEVYEDADAWNRAQQLASTCTPAELLGLEAPTLIRRLFHEEDIRLFDSEPVAFRCTCSRQTIERVLQGLGHEEVRDIVAERGTVDVACEFCGQRYVFDQVDAEALFSGSLPATPSRH